MKRPLLRGSEHGRKRMWRKNQKSISGEKWKLLKYENSGSDRDVPQEANAEINCVHPTMDYYSAIKRNELEGHNKA